MMPATVIPFARPSIAAEDIEAVVDVLKGHILTHGPQGTSFEAEFAAFLGPEAHCVAVSSCMAALHLAYLHFGIGAGDEVIVPAQTHVATAHAVSLTGARPVFVDCDTRTGNVTGDAVRAALTERTRAISVVHFAGIPCDIGPIVEIAAARGLRVIEDCALALGARRATRHVGLFGDAGCFSFYPVKHMTTGEGGMFVTRHAEIAQAVSQLRAFGVDRSHGERKIPGQYDVNGIGLNYRMSEMQAALGRSQLRRMPRSLAQRKHHFERLRAALAGLPGLRILDDPSAGAESSHYCLIAVLTGPAGDKRNEIVLRMKERGVETSIYYPHPVPRLRHYRKLFGYDASLFSGAEEISDRALALPVGSHLDDAMIDRVAGTFAGVLAEFSS